MSDYVSRIVLFPDIITICCNDFCLDNWLNSAGEWTATSRYISVCLLFAIFQMAFRMKFPKLEELHKCKYVAKHNARYYKQSQSFRFPHTPINFLLYSSDLLLYGSYCGDCLTHELCFANVATKKKQNNNLLEFCFSRKLFPSTSIQQILWNGFSQLPHNASIVTGISKLKISSESELTISMKVSYVIIRNN